MFRTNVDDKLQLNIITSNKSKDATTQMTHLMRGWVSSHIKRKTLPSFPKVFYHFYHTFNIEGLISSSLIIVIVVVVVVVVDYCCCLLR
uniref:Transmembrane protein n=1 Tax=Glossina palpalis gambiensis TaxID=67801 RepID=A0A1B0AZV5_9MUSC